MDASLIKRIADDGTELAYTEQGEGDPVVFIHGSLGDLRDWAGQVDAFAEHYRVISLSRRYHWPNAKPNRGKPYAIARHVDDLAACIDALGIAPAYLVGSSYGALTALTLAAKRSDLVRLLVLGEPPLLPWLRDSVEGAALLDAFLAGAWEPAGEAGARGDYEAMVRLFINGVIGRGAFDYLPSPVRAAMRDNAPVMAMEVRTPPDVLYPGLTCAELSRIDMPVLLPDGETSPRMFGLVQDMVADCLPDVERVTISGAFHAMHAGNCEPYNGVVLGYLARH